MPNIRLWFSPGACSVAPRILLNEIGASYQAIRTAIADGAHLTDEFVRLNPKKRVPVLALDDAVITELPAIATAISQLAPERSLMGKGGLDTVRVYEWMNWLSGTLHAQGFGALWRPLRFSADRTTHESIGAQGRATIADCFDAIEQKLVAPFAVGGAFTSVDAFLLVFYRWGNRIGIEMPARYPRYAQFARTLAARDAVVAAFEAENIALDGTR
ncbi:MAG TPA: hypothetical protein VKB52_03820 [Rhodanobacteraceae bacterium]|nr:hypothetical protein [Rhodanobacteraceae bacterium]